MPVQYDVIAVTGTYQKGNEEKKRWTKLGVVLQGKNGLSLKLETIPLGWDGWATLAEPRQKSDDVPF